MCSGKPDDHDIEAFFGVVAAFRRACLSRVYGGTAPPEHVGRDWSTQ
jgi:hypothetical protein